MANVGQPGDPEPRRARSTRAQRRLDASGGSGGFCRRLTARGRAQSRWRVLWRLRAFLVVADVRSAPPLASQQGALRELASANPRRRGGGGGAEAPPRRERDSSGRRQRSPAARRIQGPRQVRVSSPEVPESPGNPCRRAAVPGRQSLRLRHRCLPPSRRCPCRRRPTRPAARHPPRRAATSAGSSGHERAGDDPRARFGRAGDRRGPIACAGARPRYLFLGFLAITCLAGIRTIIAPAPAATVASQCAPVVDQQAESYALEFARAYLTWGPGVSRERALRPFLSSDLDYDAGLSTRGSERVEWAQLASDQPAAGGGRTIVVAAGVSSQRAPLYLAVPVSARARARLPSGGYPALVGPPTSARPSLARARRRHERRGQRARAARRRQLPGGRPANLAADMAPGAQRLAADAADARSLDRPGPVGRRAPDPELSSSPPRRATPSAGAGRSPTSSASRMPTRDRLAPTSRPPPRSREGMNPRRSQMRRRAAIVAVATAASLAGSALGPASAPTQLAYGAGVERGRGRRRGERQPDRQQDRAALSLGARAARDRARRRWRHRRLLSARDRHRGDARGDRRSFSASSSSPRPRPST